MTKESSLKQIAEEIRAVVRTAVGEDLWDSVGDEIAREIIDTVFFVDLSDPTWAVSKYVDELPEDIQIDAAAFAEITLQLFLASNNLDRPVPPEPSP